MKKKDIVSREAERQFLALLRAGLWGGKADMACFPESGLPDWKGILYLGRSQAVLPLIYDGMLTLPEEMRLHGPALMRLIAYVDRIEGLNRELDEASAEISARLAAEGIRSVLLKGQGLAVLYRIPGHRQCGDIDLYVGEENYRKAINIIRNWNEIHNEQPEMTKHTCFEFKNVELEIHKRCLDIHELRVSKHYIILEKNELCKNDCLVYLSDSKIPVYVPPIEFNLFYVFFHAFNHFMRSGLGLRQLCDLAILLHTHKKHINKTILTNFLKEYKLDREWQVFISLIVNTIGLPKDDAVLYDSSYNKLSYELLKIIENDGNFGHSKDLPTYYNRPRIFRKIGNLFVHLILLKRRYKFSPRQTRIYFFSTWRTGISNFIKGL